MVDGEGSQIAVLVHNVQGAPGTQVAFPLPSRVDASWMSRMADASTMLRTMKRFTALSLGTCIRASSACTVTYTIVCHCTFKCNPHTTVPRPVGHGLQVQEPAALGGPGVQVNAGCPTSTHQHTGGLTADALDSPTPAGGLVAAVATALLSHGGGAGQPAAETDALSMLQLQVISGEPPAGIGQHFPMHEAAWVTLMHSC